MKSKKYRLSAIVFYSVFIALALILPNMAFALQYGDFTYTVSGSTVTITKYTGTGGNVVIPSTIDGMPVVGIGDYAFYGCTGLTSVTIPDSVTSIEHHAFEVCTGLTSIVVDISNTTYSSLDGVLYNKDMTVLIEYPGGKSGGFIIPNSVTSIGVGAFYLCTSLTNVTIPNSVTSIGGGAFMACTGLTSVTIPDSVTSIERDAFFGCTGLTSVTIPNSVTSIGELAFMDCSGLTSVKIGNSVTSIGMEAFYGCTGLTSVTIPDSVTSIGELAFSGCTGLTSIVVDISNTTYSSLDGVLYNKDMTVLIEYPGGKSSGFIIPNSVTSIGGGAFYLCTSLTNVTIPNSVTSIGDSAFSECSGLTSVNIGNSVTSIGGGAFYLCTSLTSVTIPDSVTGIGDWAFCGCSGLTRAYFYGNAPSMGGAVFDDCSSNFTVCYTAGSTGFTTPTWYGYPATVCEETLIELTSFTTIPKTGNVIIQWSTESEIDNAGFNIYRAEVENSEYINIKINDAIIPAQGSPVQGASYEFVDTSVQNRKTYYYKQEDIDVSGKSTYHGPISSTPRLIYGLFK